jgi:PPOX class probable F420-dependent enzyme
MTGSSPLWPEKSRSRVTGARVARLASVRPDGRPHLVPVTYALGGDTVVTAVDHKPKSTTALQRLANIEHQPQVSLLVDHYDDDWQQLWWVRLDGTARVVRDGPERNSLLEPLVAKYAAYRDQPPTGVVVVVTIETVSDWSASG